MSPTRKPMEQKTRYDLALEYLESHFKNGTLPRAPLRGEHPADPVEMREGTESRKACAVCPWPISGAASVPGQRPALVECVYQSGVVQSFHGDCHAAWVDRSASWRREHP
jgi:hypothetical protein